MRKKYIVRLTPGEESTRKLTRARILFKADEGWTDRVICVALDMSRSTVERTRCRFIEEGFESSLSQRNPRREYGRRLDGDAKTRLIALACTSAKRTRAVDSEATGRKTGHA